MLTFSLEMLGWQWGNFSAAPTFFPTAVGHGMLKLSRDLVGKGPLCSPLFPAASTSHCSGQMEVVQRIRDAGTDTGFLIFYLVTLERAKYNIQNRGNGNKEAADFHAGIPAHMAVPTLSCSCPWLLSGLLLLCSKALLFVTQKEPFRAVSESGLIFLSCTSHAHAL